MDNSQSKTDTCLRLFDYQQSDKTIDTSWTMVNDNVMGGRSTGQFIVNENYLTFSGFINSNGGGFSSIRHSVPSSSFSGIDHIRLSVRSDGRPYTLSLADDFSKPRGISHRARIGVNASSEFQDVNIPVNDLRPMFRGRRVQAPELNTNRIQELRIMLSDTVDGDFVLDIAWIDICR